jgi:hypothetical protein
VATVDLWIVRGANEARVDPEAALGKLARDRFGGDRIRQRPSGQSQNKVEREAGLGEGRAPETIQKSSVPVRLRLRRDSCVDLHRSVPADALALLLFRRFSPHTKLDIAQSCAKRGRHCTKSGSFALLVDPPVPCLTFLIRSSVLHRRIRPFTPATEHTCLPSGGSPAFAPSPRTNLETTDLLLTPSLHHAYSNGNVGPPACLGAYRLRRFTPRLIQLRESEEPRERKAVRERHARL